MISKQDLEMLLKKEYATTLRVLKAFPPEKGNFKPHEQANEAIRIASTFVFEMYLFKMYLLGEPMDRTKFQTYKPENMPAAIKDFEKESKEVIKQFEAMPESNLEKTIEFGGRTFNGSEFAHMMIHDQIHHRGQLTTYVRMAGGKVPSVYGPSSDDKTTNL